MKMENLVNNIIIDKSLQNKSGIYKIQIKDSVYVGSGVNIYQRLHMHKRLILKNKHHNIKLQRKYNKYLDFNYQIIEFCEKGSLIEREQYYIDTLNPDLNISPTAFSNYGFKHSEDTRKRMSEIHKGRKWSKESKQKLSDSSKGVPKSEEHKRKISEKLKGRKLSKKTIDKMIHSRTGKHHSDKTKKKISNSHKNKIIPVEQRLKMSESMKNKFESGYVHPTQKLTNSQIIEVLNFLKEGVKNKDLANQYNVSTQVITYIKKYKNGLLTNI